MKLLMACALVGAVACSATTSETATTSAADTQPSPVTKESLGALIFADMNLSEPAGQSCATCHDAQHGFADGRGTSTSEGAIAGRFGVRNAPSIAYASFVPPLLPASGEAGYIGGMFWDGRVDTLQDQATGPLLNPLEMNNADGAMIVRKLKASSYAQQFITIYGQGALDDTDTALANLADAVSAYETQLAGFTRFSSKYDAQLAGKATFTPEEARGFALFEDKKTGPCTPQHDGSMAPPCGCAQCHLDKPQDDGTPPMFTDFGYDNIGIPKNTANPFYQLPPSLNPGGASFIDEGLSAAVPNPTQKGHFKAPSIRNVALTAPYGHNGYFATLKDIVHFYNTRDVAGAWPPPEEPNQMNATGLGNLGLTDQEESDLVAFLGTLSDGYFTP
jgi:cytochrome c peroxidase